MIYELKQKIRHSKWGENTTKWMENTPFFPFCYKMLCFAKLAEIPSITGRDTKKVFRYFQENQNKIANITNALADEKSQTIFLKSISNRSKGVYCLEGTHKDQYFPKDIIHLSNDEVFVDCGAYTGDTIAQFLQETNGQYKKIIAFEPDPKTFIKLKAQPIKDCFYFNGGVWNQTETLSFCAAGDMGSSLVIEKQAEKIEVPVWAMDEMPQCADMTFLKMDIEGAELNALKGAEKTIRKQRPKMAICIYHSNQDMLEIPLWVMSLNMGYKLYVRHHGENCLEETVLYAV